MGTWAWTHHAQVPWGDIGMISQAEKPQGGFSAWGVSRHFTLAKDVTAACGDATVMFFSHEKNMMGVSQHATLGRRCRRQLRPGGMLRLQQRDTWTPRHEK